MPVHFPAVNDIPLRNSPLVDVVCQVKFPPLLKIAEGRPTEFQERIRHRFPEFAEQHGMVLRVEPNIGEPALELERSGRLYGFRTEEGDATVTLSTDFYGLRTTNYTVWPEFSRDLSIVHDAVVAVFDPAYATRVGLRFVNRLTPENTGRDDITAVAALLKPSLVSQLETNAWSSPEEMASRVVVSDDRAKLAIRVALDSSEQPAGFVLDFDYYEEGRSSLDGVVERCNQYHDAIYRAFRWAVDVDAVAAFEPAGGE